MLWLSLSNQAHIRIQCEHIVNTYSCTVDNTGVISFHFNFTLMQTCVKADAGRIPRWKQSATVDINHIAPPLWHLHVIWCVGTSQYLVSQVSGEDKAYAAGYVTFGKHNLTSVRFYFLSLEGCHVSPDCHINPCKAGLLEKIILPLP